MMRVSRLHRPIGPRRRCAAAALARGIAQSKEVGRCAIEIERAAVDDLMLEESCRVPGGKFRGGEVRNLPPETRHCVLGGQRKVEPDAPHALALEVERRTL